RAAVTVRQDRLGAVPGDDVLPARGDFSEGLGPADRLPVAAALGAHPPQRLLEPVGVIHVIEVGAHLGAEPALGDGVVPVAVKADSAAVLDLGDDTTGVGAIVWADAADLQGRWHDRKSSAERVVTGHG